MRTQRVQSPSHFDSAGQGFAKRNRAAFPFSPIRRCVADIDTYIVNSPCRRWAICTSNYIRIFNSRLVANGIRLSSRQTRTKLTQCITSIISVPSSDREVAADGQQLFTAIRMGPYDTRNCSSSFDVDSIAWFENLAQRGSQCVFPLREWFVRGSFVVV
jgi:hypothetical protein